MYRTSCFLVLGLVFAGLSGVSAGAQSFQDIGRALDALAGPQPQPQRPAARPQPAPAQAQSGDRCANYARTMVQQNQQARQMRCQNWNSHSNYDHHYSWCQARPPQAAQTALASWGTRFQTCQFAASGSPAARAQTSRSDPAFCQNVYGPQLTQIWAQAQQRGCRGFVSRNNNFQGHVNWCMGRSRPVAERAIADNRRSAAACR